MGSKNPTDAHVFAQGQVRAISFYSPTFISTPIAGGESVRMLRTELDPAVYADPYNFQCGYVLLVDKSLGTSHALAWPYRNAPQ